MARKPLYFASLMVGAGDADGSVGERSTARPRRSAPRSTAWGPTRARLVSSVFIMALRTCRWDTTG
jgi:phosphotransacetylase